MKNRVKLKTLLIVLAAYLFVLANIGGLGGAVLVILVLLYSMIAIVVGAALLKSDLEKQERETETFRRTLPLRRLGGLLVDFQHVFYHEEDLLPEILDEINIRLEQRSVVSGLEKKKFTDTDKKLTKSETREFLVSVSEPNLRGTQIAAVIHLRSSKTQSIQWWILSRGFIDQNKKIAVLASAPIALPFWIVSLIKHELALASSVRTIYDAYYNTLDVVTDARTLHTAIFDALVDTLEKHGVDVSDLKLQRAQVMNINIRGGRVRFGNIVQALRQTNTVQTTGAKR